MTGTADVEEMIEHRLREIEEQLRPFAELEAERDRLRRALDALRSQPDARRDLASTPARSPNSNRRGSKRAARGSNLQAIVSHVTANPGATSGEIADATGISRGVVYSAVSRLTSGGKLRREPRPDGQVAYHAVTQR